MEEATEVIELDDGEVRFTEPTVAVLRTRDFHRVFTDSYEALGDAPCLPKSPEYATPEERLEWLKSDERSRWWKEYHRAARDMEAWMEALDEALAPISYTSAWLARQLKKRFEAKWLVGFAYTLDAEALPDWAKLVLKQLSEPRPGPLLNQFLFDALNEIAEGVEMYSDDGGCDLCAELDSDFIAVSGCFRPIDWVQSRCEIEDAYPRLAMLGRALAHSRTVEEVREEAAQLQRLHAMTPEEYPAGYAEIWGDSDDGHYAYIAMAFQVEITQRLALILFDIAKHCGVEVVPDSEEVAS